MPKKAVAVLDTMWDWEAKTSSAGYVQAPRFFRINPRNHTGRRLYWFLGYDPSRLLRPPVPGMNCAEDCWSLIVTDACKELVTSASGRGKPDKAWLKQNLSELWPFDLLLVCGKTAQATYEQAWAPRPCRIIEMPHPAARTWTAESLEKTKRFIQEGRQSLSLNFVRMDGPSKRYRLVATSLLPY